VRLLAENLDRAADLAIGQHERDKWGEAHIQLEGASEPDASKDCGSVKRTVWMLDQPVFVVLRMPRVQHISTTVTSLFPSLLPKAKAAAKPLPPRTENCPSAQQIESKQSTHSKSVLLPLRFLAFFFGHSSSNQDSQRL
jgi:hypothetical protein